MKKTILTIATAIAMAGNILAQTKPVQYGSTTNQEGHTVKTVQIGTQTWFAENLNVNTYNDGTAIPNVTDGIVWIKLTTGAYCNYDNQDSNAATYGRLYNWHTVNTGKLCPTGWHVPNYAEWNTLRNYLIAKGYNYDGTTTDNKIAKALASTTGWDSFTTPGTPGNDPFTNNKSGFSALPGCYRNKNGAFVNVGNVGCWWSSTEDTTDNASFWSVLYSVAILHNGSNFKVSGMSVRCVHD